jgi:uncharacterized protein YcfJ
MNALLRNALLAAVVAITTQASAEVTFYERNNFEGQSFTADRTIANFDRFGFNDRASSAVVTQDRWEVCEDARFGGQCVVLRPGRYGSLVAMGLNDRVSSARSLRQDARIDEERYAPMPVAAQVSFYERKSYQGRSFTTDKQINNFVRRGFNDRVSSVVVVGGPWEVCEDIRFKGRCVVLRPGQYNSLSALGLNDRVSSARAVRSDDARYAVAPMAAPDYRRRNDERLFEANVTGVRAVVGTPEQRCWVEREQVSQERGAANIPAAIAGALIGGILGHQVGGGSGKDIATAGAAVAGAAIGASIGRNGSAAPANTQDVQRCESVAGQVRPQYWDVTYNFRGQEHHIQTTTPPGATVTVNAQGEPRS